MEVKNYLLAQRLLREAISRPSDIRRFAHYRHSAHLIANSKSDASGTLPPGLGARTASLLREEEEHRLSHAPHASAAVPYDIVEQHRLKVTEIVSGLNKNLVVQVTGSHRRGAPFSSNLQLLLSHPQTEVGEQLTHLQKAVRHMVSACYADANTVHRLGPDHLTFLGSLERLDPGECHKETTEVPDIVSRIKTKLPHWDISSSPSGQVSKMHHERNRRNMLRVSVRWSSSDRFAGKLLLSTGPERFRQRFRTGCPKHLCLRPDGMLIDLHQAVNESDECGDSVVRAETERTLFVKSCQPFIHPFHR